MSKKLINNTSGTAFVELALVLPLLACMLLGAAELARLAYATIEVTNAARAGTAYGSYNAIYAQDVAGMQAAATQDSSDVVSIAPPVAGPCICPASYSTVNLPSCSFPAGTTPCSSYTAETEFVAVSTTAVVDTGIHLPGLPTTYTLNGYSTMRVNIP